MDAEIEQYLPHRPPMIMIDGLLSCNQNAAVAVKCFEDGGYGTMEGFVAETFLIEAMAQTAAALYGKRSQEQGMTPPPGMLVGVDRFEFMALAKTRYRLEIAINLNTVIGEFHMASGTIRQFGQIIAKGELKLYIKRL